MPLDDEPTDLSDEGLGLLRVRVTELRDRLDDSVRRVDSQVRVLHYGSQDPRYIRDAWERVASPPPLYDLLHGSAQSLVAELLQPSVVQRQHVLGEGCPGEASQRGQPLQVTLLRGLLRHVPHSRLWL